uniref:Uncharacterized protein n=1 Tax=Triticum urartu TaxID=4572 RepID=A0A8R7TV27_TRIUA
MATSSSPRRSPRTPSMPCCRPKASPSQDHPAVAARRQELLRPVAPAPTPPRAGFAQLQGSTPRPTPLLPSTTTELTTPLSCQSNQMLESRSQTPPSTMTPTTPEVPTTTCCPLTTTRSS